LAGCESTTHVANLEQAREHYDGQNYTMAYLRSKEAANAAPAGAKRDEAMYLAGLSAAQVGKDDEATQYLEKAMRSDNPAIVGRAASQLGLLQLANHRPREAASLFARAASNLDGHAAQLAAQHAARAWHDAGDEAEAAKWRAIGWPQRYGGTGTAFSVQIGAFLDRNHAEVAARSVRTDAARAGLDPVRIVPTHDERGRSLYLVQLGRFASRSAADHARQELGGQRSIIATYAIER
jgi:cell division septation protein DedD